MKRYLVVFGLVFVLLSLSLGTIAAQDEDPTPTLDEVTILARSPFPTPPGRDVNTYIQKIEEDLGIQIDFQFVPTNEIETRIATVLASGEIPDLVVGHPDAYPILLGAIQQGAFLSLEDMGLLDEIDNYVGLSQIPDSIWANSAINGKIYGVPTAAQEYHNGTFIRMDWLEALGLEVPTTAEEFKDVLAAFANDDPDGNGSNDTYGFSLAGDQGTWISFMEIFGVPNGWRLNEDGSLTNAAVTDEMRATVAYMHELYELGVFNQDFPALTRSEMLTEFASGISGGFEQNLASGYDLQGADLRSVVPDAVVYPITPPVAEGYDRVTYLRTAYNTVTHINSKYRNDPDAVRDLLTVIDYWLRPDTEEFINFGFEGVHHTVNDDGSLVQTEQGTNEIGWIRAWGPRHYLRYVDAPYVTSATREQIIEDTARLAEFGISNPTWGLYPELAMDDPTASLDDFATNTFIRMITGDQSLDEWDAFVAEWYDRGGEMLTNSLQETYQQVNES